jgi:hypothetical protein
MLPAPRDPVPPEAVRPDPPPDTPSLVTLLTGLLRGAGAQAARAVDGRNWVPLAEVGLSDGDDVPALLQLTRSATTAGRSRGEWLEDVVVTLGRTVHVLRECGGAVLHARLDPARGDTAAVRRALAATEMQSAVEVAMRAAPAAGRPAPVDGPTMPAMQPVTSPSPPRQPPPSPPPRRPGPGVPAPPPQPVPPPSAPARPLARMPEPVPPPPPLPLPAGMPGARGEDPALVRVDGATPPARSGTLALLALPPVEGTPATAPSDSAPSDSAAPVASLPRRRRGAPAPVGRPSNVAITPAVLRQAWASDIGTMHRLLGALQRFA